MKVIDAAVVRRNIVHSSGKKVNHVRISKHCMHLEEYITF